MSEPMRLTPLKSTKAANSPFRSPFNKVIPSNDAENVDCNTPKLQAARYVIKRKLPPSQSSRKKFCVSKELSNDTVGRYSNEIFFSDLEILRKRIKEKQQSISHLKGETQSPEKCKVDNLLADIKMWRNVCQEALERLRRDVQEKNAQVVSMNELLSTLGIPASLVKFSMENNTFED